MDDQILQALRTDRLIDITTYGRRSGKPSRKETVFHYIDNTIYLTGRPGKRDWYANLLANPDFIIHLKESLQYDLQVRATPIIDLSERRAVLTKVLERNGKSGEIEEWVAGSPLVSVAISR